MRCDWQTYVSELDGTADRYLLVQPDDAAAHGLDVVVALHGHGSGPDQVFTHPRLVGVVDLLLQEGITLIGPRLRGDAWMNREAEADLVQLAAMLRETFRPRRMLLTGGSMGGTATLIFEAHHPEMFDGHLAFCPATDMAAFYRFCRAGNGPAVLGEIADAIERSYGGDPDSAADEYAYRSSVRYADRLVRPTVFLHGAMDATVPVEHSRRLAVAASGRPGVTYIEGPADDHDSIISPHVIAAHVQQLLRR